MFINILDSVMTVSNLFQTSYYKRPWLNFIAQSFNQTINTRVSEEDCDVLKHPDVKAKSITKKIKHRR